MCHLCRFGFLCMHWLGCDVILFVCFLIWARPCVHVHYLVPLCSVSFCTKTIDDDPMKNSSVCCHFPLLPCWLDWSQCWETILICTAAERAEKREEATEMSLKATPTENTPQQMVSTTANRSYRDPHGYQYEGFPPFPLWMGGSGTILH